jgi:hypothetical protein
MISNPDTNNFITRLIIAFMFKLPDLLTIYTCTDVDESIHNYSPSFFCSAPSTARFWLVMPEMI